MNILLVTDAWAPLVNGVARTFAQVRAQCEAKGHRVDVVSPDRFRTVPCPSYPQIPLAVFPGRRLRAVLEKVRPDAVHLATEGPLGLAARNLLVRRALPFTTSYATRFPEYLAARLPVPLRWGYAAMRWFHAPSRAVMVATETLRRELAGHGFANLRTWSRGVDAELFRPG
ncbi:MAG TPA: glycosyltransferase, partial [Alphaproteobacteria bacterium]